MTFSKLALNFNPSPEVVLGRKMSRGYFAKIHRGVVFHLQRRRNLTLRGDIVC